MPKILPNLRETLLQEGKNILCDVGYENLNVRDLAKKCNIGTGTFYNYFSTKDLLIISIITEDWNKVEKKCSSVTYAKNLSPKQKLKHIYDNIKTFLSNYMETFMLLTTKKNSKCNRDEILSTTYQTINNILVFHTTLGDIHPKVPSEVLSKIILNGIVSISKDSTISFDHFYDSIKL